MKARHLAALSSALAALTAMTALLAGAPAQARDAVLDAALAAQVQRWDTEARAGRASAACNAAFHQARLGAASKEVDVRLREADTVGGLCTADNDRLGHFLVLLDTFADLCNRDLELDEYSRTILGTLRPALNLGPLKLDPVLDASFTALLTDLAFLSRDYKTIEGLTGAAERRFERLAIPRSRSWVVALTNRGYARNATGDPDGALQALERAQAMVFELGAADPILIATLYRRLIAVHHAQGRYDRAVALTDQALKMLPEGSQPSQRASMNFNMGGMLLELGLYDAAIDAFNQAKTFYLLRGDEKRLASALWSLGKAWQHKGLVERALQLYRQAERLQLDKGYVDDLPQTYVSLGILHENLSTPQSYAEAAAYYDKAEALHKANAASNPAPKAGGDDMPLMLAINRAKLYERLGQYARAEKEYLGAEKLVAASGRPSHVLENNLAYISLRLGKFEQARTYALKAIDRLDDTVRTGFYLRGAGNLQFIEGSRAPYATASRALLGLGDVPGALAYHEAGRDRVRQTMVRLRKAAPADGETDEKWRRLAQIDRELATINQRAAQLPSSDERESLARRRTTLAAERERVEGSLFQRPGLFAKVFGSRGFDPTALQALQAGLATDEAIVDYQFSAWGQSERRLEVRAFVIRRDSLRVVELFEGPMGAATTGLLAEFLELNKPQSLLRHQKDGALPQYAHRLDSGARGLYRLLFEKLTPALKGTNQLVIIPSGPLNLLPFEALKNAQGRLLIEDHVISYGTSLDDVRRRAPRSGGKALVVGDIDFGSRREGLRSWPAIGGSREMLDEITQSAAFGAGTAQLRGSGATEQRFKAAAKGHGLLVIWTHGKFDDHEQTPELLQRATSASGTSIESVEELDAYLRQQQLRQFADPLSSAFVVFAKANEGGDGTDDGYLTAREVMNLDLESVDLTVLAACETGLGQASSSEGLLGLQWAFSLAGSRQLLLSLWQVDARWTGTLLKSFFAHQPQSGSARALQQAKLEAIRQLRQQNLEPYPFYWAGFVLSGR